MVEVEGNGAVFELAAVVAAVEVVAREVLAVAGVVAEEVVAKEVVVAAVAVLVAESVLAAVAVVTVANELDTEIDAMSSPFVVVDGVMRFGGEVAGGKCC